MIDVIYQLWCKLTWAMLTLLSFSGHFQVMYYKPFHNYETLNVGGKKSLRMQKKRSLEVFLTWGKRVNVNNSRWKWKWFDE